MLNLIKTTLSLKKHDVMGLIPSYVLLSPKTGKGIIKTSNIPPQLYNTGNRPKRYKKRNPKDPLTPSDWTRHRQNLLWSLQSNFNENDSHCWFITLTFKDKRIKKTETALNLGKAFCKCFNTKTQKAVYSIVIELNADHHPHIHMVLQTPKIVTEDVIKAKWNKGFINAQQSPRNWERITNYLIKSYSPNEDMFFNKELAKDLTAELNDWNKYMTGLMLSHPWDYKRLGYIGKQFYKEKL